MNLSKALNVFFFGIIIFLLGYVWTPPASDDLSAENVEEAPSTPPSRSEEGMLSYVRPPFLTVAWDRVVLKSEGHEVTIDSEPLLEAFKGQLRGLVKTDNPFPGGYRTGHPSFTFYIYAGEKEYRFQSLEQDFFMDEDGEAFYRSDADYTQLAKALLPKPTGYPQENVWSKLYHSGLMQGEKEFAYPVLESFRIHGIVSTFIAMDKKEVVAPPIPHETYQEKFTFFYFGQRVEMRLYDEYIHLVETAQEVAPTDQVEVWYKVSLESIQNMLAVLRAG